jgi:phosphatidylethanolamine/phosphatidyl-N-methylethanolamine N-methyltransferase
MHTEDKAWLDYRNRFSKVYDESNYASPLQSFAMRASHKLVERGLGPETFFPRVLEIGAGTGEHFAFVRHRFDEYILTDHDAEALQVARRKIGGTAKGNIAFDVQSGAGLTYADQSFDRVLAVHVLEHIYQPHLAIKEWLRVLKPGGMLSILIPTDPGLAWRLGRHFGPRRNALAQGIAYDYVMAREHVNSCNNLIAILRHYLPEAREGWWPLPVPSIDMNLFFAFHALVQKPGGER